MSPEDQTRNEPQKKPAATPAPFARRGARREEAEESDLGAQIREREAQEDDRPITPLQQHEEPKLH